MELLIILGPGMGHFPIFYCTEVFRLVVLKNLKSVLCMQEWFFWVRCGLQDLSHTKFSIHEVIIQQIQTVCFIGTHGFQMPLVCPKSVGWGNMGI